MASITSTLASATAVPAVPAYLSIVRDEAALADKFASATPQVKAEIAYLNKQAPRLTSADALMKDYRALGIVLKSFGMKDQLAYPGLVRRLLTEDPTSKTSTAQKIGNASYLRFATAMNQYKTNPLADAKSLAAVTKAYVLNGYEAAQGQQIPGMEQALAFRRQASQVTSIAQLMSNTPVLKVAVTQTGIDYATFGAMDYNRQVALLTKKVKLADLQNPTKVDRIAEQYLISAGQDAMAWGATTTATNTVASLFGATGTTSVLSLFA